MRFEEYAAASLDPLFRFASVLTGDRGIAEDVVQDVLTKLHQRWGELSRVTNLDAYVRRMVVNEYLSWRRRWARILPSASVQVPEDDAPDAATQHAERDNLATELKALPPKQRAAIVLRFYEDMSDEDAAVILGCSPSTVRTHVSRALRALRISLADDRELQRKEP
ncbi:MAG TPA: SigE family RNA polymerase sigma factor [Jatrophihabitans sp.]